MYNTFKTDDGIEIRDSDGNVVAGPSDTDPVRGNGLSILLTDAGFDEEQISAIRIALGDVKHLEDRDDTS